MSEIKDLYVIEWMGPYNSLEELYQRTESDKCCIYLITGKLPRERNIGIKYVGISKRPVYKRLREKDHIEKQAIIREKKFWAGYFSISKYNNISTPLRRERLEMVETLLIRYLFSISKSKMINEKKIYSDPKKPIVLISRGRKKYSDDVRINKPSELSDLPDVLMYVDRNFYASGKLRNVMCSE